MPDIKLLNGGPCYFAVEVDVAKCPFKESDTWSKLGASFLRQPSVIPKPLPPPSPPEKRPHGTEKPLKRVVCLISQDHQHPDDPKVKSCYSVDVITSAEELPPECRIMLYYYVEFLDIDEVKGAAKRALEGYPPCPNREGWVTVEEAQKNDVLMKFMDTVGPYITVDYLLTTCVHTHGLIYNLCIIISNVAALAVCGIYKEKLAFGT